MLTKSIVRTWPKLILQVVTGKKRFSEYLGDAERLFLELHANDGDDKIDVVGYSIFERLQRLVDASAISEDSVNFYNVFKHQYNFTSNKCEKSTIQYLVPGFELTTSYE